ncbi:MAG: HDIG domain-containing protein [Christensenellaceae bacterium]|jgi:putative nucleotidyltransferase with HDIG domain|nr:HDIG domain-containing protein [Christensenellaceae bacterium]
MIPTRSEAFEILKKYTKNEALLRHALAVEGCMRHFAALYGEDAELWGVCGLLHDIDYELYPSEHCKKAPELLRAENVDETIIRAVVSHGYAIAVDVEPLSSMEKTLYAIDELTGLITACAIMRPSKSVSDLELKSVKKKYKVLNFAAGVDRAVIERGAEMLCKDIDFLIGECILGMRACAEAIGL